MSPGKWRPFCLGLNVLTHRGRVTHIYMLQSTVPSLDQIMACHSLFVRHQTVIWNNIGLLLILQLGTNFSEILTNIRHYFTTVISVNLQQFLSKKMNFKISSTTWWPLGAGLNVLITRTIFSRKTQNIHISHRKACLQKLCLSDSVRAIRRPPEPIITTVSVRSIWKVRPSTDIGPPAL